MSPDEFDAWRRKEFESMPRQDMDKLSEEQRKEMAEFLAKNELKIDFEGQLVKIYVDFLKHSNLGEAQMHVAKRVAALTAKAADVAKTSSERALGVATQSHNIQVELTSLTAAVSESTGKSAELLTDVGRLISKWDRDNEATRGKIRRLNCSMLTLTIAGVLAAVWAGCLATQGLNLQRQSLEIDRKALVLQEREQSGSHAHAASHATEQKNRLADPGGQSGPGEAASASGSGPLAAPKAGSSPKEPGLESPPKSPAAQSPPDTKPVIAPAPPAS